MANNRETLSRLWLILRHVPRYPRKTTVQALSQYLSQQGEPVSERTLQRDLGYLSAIFPLVVDDRTKPFGWGWQKDARSFDLPGMTVDEALTWVLAEQHVAAMLPGSTLDHLRPYFSAARDRLNGEPVPQRGRSWLGKVRTVPPTQPLIPPAIDDEVQRLVSEALLHEHQIELRYRRKGEPAGKTYQAHPLALIQRGGVLYLFARLFDYPNARLLAMHRIEEVTPLPERVAEPPPGFDLDEELARGRLDFGTGEVIAIRLRFFDGKGEHLNETPLSPDQVIHTDPDRPGEMTVTATVAATPQLTWWLQGFGDGVEVLAPATLRDTLAATARRMAARYRARAPSAKTGRQAAVSDSEINNPAL